MKEYDLFVKYYEEIVRPEEGQLDDEIYFINEVIEDYKPDIKDILECACGTGLVMNELIKKGYSVTGFDLSEKMLNKAKELMPEEVLLKEDMTNFDLGKKFDMVLCNYNSICHLLTFEDWNNFMKCANNHLKDGGIFVFDINTLFEFNSLVEDYNMTKEIGEDTLCLDVKKNEKHFYWDVKMFVKGEDGRFDLVRERVSENSFEIADVKKALEENGFLLEGLVDYHTLEVTPESERVYFVASKK